MTIDMTITGTLCIHLGLIMLTLKCAYAGIIIAILVHANNGIEGDMLHDSGPTTQEVIGLETTGKIPTAQEVNGLYKCDLVNVIIMFCRCSFNL